MLTGGRDYFDIMSIFQVGQAYTGGHCGNLREAKGWAIQEDVQHLFLKGFF